MARNFDPSIATTEPASSPRLRQTAINCWHANLIGSALSRLKSAIVLKSGASLPVSHISSTLRPAREPDRDEVEPVDKSIDHAHRVVSVYVVVEALGEGLFGGDPGPQQNVP